MPPAVPSPPSTEPKPSQKARWTDRFKRLLPARLKSTSQKASASTPTLTGLQQDDQIAAGQHGLRPASVNDIPIDGEATSTNSLGPGFPVSSPLIPSPSPTVEAAPRHAAGSLPPAVSVQDPGRPITTALPDSSMSNVVNPDEDSTGPQAQDPSTTVKRNAKTAWNGFKLVAKNVEPFLEGTPFKIPIAVLNKIIETAEAVIDNKESMAKLLLPVGQRLQIMGEELSRNQRPRDIDPTLKRFTETLKKAEEQLDEMHNQGLIRHALNSAEHPKDIADIFRQVDEATKNFLLELHLANFRQTNSIKKDTEITRLSDGRLKLIQEARHEGLRRDPPLKPCVGETRKAVVEDIISWCKDTSPDRPVYWLSGMAGTGKSTIAYTICKQLEDDGEASRLGASFFCWRQIAAHHQQENIIPSIAHELALKLPRFRQALLDSEVDANLPSLEKYLEMLLIKPWVASIRDHQRLPPLVVVVDALDELEGKGGASFLKDLLEKTRTHQDQFHGLKFLITSRQDPRIVDVVEGENSDSPLPACDLQKVPREIANKDIYSYLQSSLPGLQSAPELHQLAKQTDGLFIYAATAVRYIIPESEDIEGTSYRRQMERLKRVVTAWPSKAARGPEGLLVDHLYEEILDTYLSKKAECDREEPLSILHTILCAEEPLLISDIPELSFKATSKEEVLALRRALHSVLYLSPSGHIYPYHKSFVDFMGDPSRFVNQEHATIRCLAPEVQVHLTKTCFRLMDGLRFNICDLPSSFLNDSEIPDLPSHITQSISSALRYACCHWAAHLSKIQTEDQTKREGIVTLVKRWLNERLLFWFEAMNLLKSMNKCYKSLLTAHRWIGRDITAELVMNLGAAENLATLFGSNSMAESTPHLYLSALAVSPRHSNLIKLWHERFSRISLVVALLNVTGPLLQLHHEERVFSVAFSLDGLYVISGSGDNTVRIWDVATGKQLKQLDGHEGDVNSAAFSPDGLYAISGSDDQTVRIWDVATGKQLKQLDGHEDKVWSVAFSPDGLHAISGSEDKTVRIWDVATGKQLKQLDGHNSGVNSVAFAPDGLFAISGSFEKTVRLWNVSTGEQLKQLDGHEKTVWSVAFSHDGLCAISGSDDKTVRIWDVSTGKQVKQLDGHEECVNSVAFSPDGLHAISGSNDKTVRIWDVVTGKQLTQLDRHEGFVFSVAFSPDGLRAISGSEDMTVRLWDVSTGKQLKQLDGHNSDIDVFARKQLQRLDGHQDEVWSVAFSPDGLHAISGSDDWTVRIWDVATGKLLQQLDGHNGGVNSAAFALDGLFAISGSDDNTVRIWDVSNGNQLKQLDGHKARVWSVSFSPDGLYAISGSDDETVRIWDVATGKQLKQMDGHNNGVKSVAFSYNGLQALSGLTDRTVRVWNVSTGKQWKQLDGHDGSVLSVAFSQDGLHAISGSSDDTVRIWDVATRSQLQQLDGHNESVWSVAFSPDGLHAISGSFDKIVRIWDVLTGTLLTQLDGHEDSVLSVAFSLDGLHAISGSADKTVHIWNLATLGTADAEWHVSSDGWITTSNNTRCLWLPPDMHRFLHSPQCLVISSQGRVTVDLTNAALGTEWAQFYDQHGNV
ncbi:WD40-repeat-containing domain protein [Mycena vulgaris]|nr:WD40-repeat-containing domain protein [Mycena vulgaris]